MIPAGLLFGGLNSSNSYIQIYSDVSVQLVDGIAGIVILFVAAPERFEPLERDSGDVSASLGDHRGFMG